MCLELAFYTTFTLITQAHTLPHPHIHTNIHTIALYVLGVGFLCQFDINQWLFSLTPLTTIHRLHMHTSSQMHTHPRKCTHTSSQMYTHILINVHTHILTNAHTLALYPNLTSIKHILGLSVPEVVPIINCISHKWAHSEMKISILEEKFKKYRTFHSFHKLQQHIILFIHSSY